MPKLISRVHAIIERTEEGDNPQYKIIDNESLNGLAVNGVRVKEAVLKYVSRQIIAALYSVFNFFRHNDIVVFGGATNAAVGVSAPQSSDLVYTFVDPRGRCLALS